MKFQGAYRAIARLNAHRSHMRALNPGVDVGTLAAARGRHEARELMLNERHERRAARKWGAEGRLDLVASLKDGAYVRA